MGVAKQPTPVSARAHGATRALPGAGGSVLLAFVGADERRLSTVGGLSIGIMSATQGAFTRRQMLLDIGQGARVAASAYDPMRPPTLSLRASRAGAVVAGWESAQRRAEDAPQLLRPGLLAS
ncbi:MAG TPA: hypothetical protein VH025_07325, partial [Solirubrobacteraceae bacterium]|nr:hypothetical protein [Solirubrobacteraceae bacterium]